MARKKLGDTIEKNVLINSKRRCALCYGLNRDLSIKQGQIAHIDKDNSNNSENNLLFLCLSHHDMYDSVTSQSKNITKKELEHYRDELYEYLVSSEFENYCDINSVENREREIFSKIYNLLFASNAMNCLQNLTLTAEFSDGFLEYLEEFTITCEQDPSFCFKNKQMEKLKVHIYSGLRNFMYIQSFNVKYNVETEKFQIPVTLSNYGEICEKLDESRVLACSSYNKLIQMGVQLGYI